MDGENHQHQEQERVADYLALERYIQELQAGHAPFPPAALTPSQVGVYRMVLLFRAAATEGTALPRPAFVAALQVQLEHELQQSRTVQPFTSPQSKRQKQSPSTSRRTWLMGGVSVVFWLVIGAIIEHVVEQVGNYRQSETSGSTTSSTSPVYLPLPEGLSTTWYAVIPLALLGETPQRFATDTIVGYILREESGGDHPGRGEILAFSAACTHMGCLVQWQQADRTFFCPCHGALFTQEGDVDRHSSPPGVLSPLPRLQTKVEDGKVYVRVPLRQAGVTS
jgi:Rieske Fe-S protein